MERVISDEERIRRAIEISQKRNRINDPRDMTRVNVSNKKNYKLFKKMILQIIICLLIYFIFYLITTTNYAFSDDIINKTNSVLNYDLNFEKLYKDCRKFMSNTFNITENSNNMLEKQIEENTVEQSNVIKKNIENVAINNEGKNKNEETNKKTEEIKSKTQMEQDVETVKKLCKFIKPLNGKITSEYGEREVTAKFMSANHKGIDIAANSGTSIKSAIDGTVSVASSNSEYGNFIKIVNKDVMTVYAHCKKLKVKEGEKVKKGQTIATVGSTGNSTGPHLHFEIRLSGRYINPRLVIKF